MKFLIAKIKKAKLNFSNRPINLKKKIIFFKRI